MLRTLVVLVLTLVLSACGLAQKLRQSSVTRPPSRVVTVEAPRPDTKVLLAPADWGELARDAAYRIAQRASQNKELSSRPIWVIEPTVRTQFSIALHQYLQSNLTEMGMTVSQKAGADNLGLLAEVQPVRLASGMQVVVTAALGNGSRYLFRMTESYAVNTADARLYDASFTPPPPPPTAVTRMPVKGKP
ncbi:hypothetical protein [Chitinimonas sp. BJYL2]|uniref:hypothetical protein n=1 Tax=Chitinimonas sp. BJYL2 TaxID=2976696 RepID=UPI0022B3F17D|nr:hypothetical protein [Chitinimonas sp. BJYL2]